MTFKVFIIAACVVFAEVFVNEIYIQYIWLKCYYPRFSSLILWLSVISRKECQVFFVFLLDIYVHNYKQNGCEIMRNILLTTWTARIIVLNSIVLQQINEVCNVCSPVLCFLQTPFQCSCINILFTIAIAHPVFAKLYDICDCIDLN